jgi:hypothetical protein
VFGMVLRYKTRFPDQNQYVGLCNGDSLSFLRIWTENKLRGLNPRANSTDRATAACWRS